MLELLVFNKELCCEVYIRKRGFFMLHEIGLAALTLIARRFENSANKKNTQARLLYIIRKRISCADPQTLRFENSANKKKHASEAWCFFLFALFIRDPERIRTSNRQSRNLIFYPVELLGQKHLYYRCCIVIFFNLIGAPLQVCLWFSRLLFLTLL